MKHLILNYTSIQCWMTSADIYKILRYLFPDATLSKKSFKTALRRLVRSGDIITKQYNGEGSPKLLYLRSDKH